MISILDLYDASIGCMIDVKKIINISILVVNCCQSTEKLQHYKIRQIYMEMLKSRSQIFHIHFTALAYTDISHIFHITSQPQALL